MFNPPAAAPQSFSSSFAASLTHLPTSAAELAQLQIAGGVSTAQQQLHPASRSLFSSANAMPAPVPAELSFGSNQLSAGQMNHPSPTGSDGTFAHVDFFQQQQAQHQHPYQQQQQQQQQYPQLIPQPHHQPPFYQHNQHEQVSAPALGHDPRLLAMSASPPYSSSLAPLSQHPQSQQQRVGVHQQQQYRHQQLQQQASLSFAQHSQVQVQAQAQSRPSALQQHLSSPSQYAGPVSPTAWSLSAAAGIAPNNNSPMVPTSTTNPPGSALGLPSYEYMSAFPPTQQQAFQSQQRQQQPQPEQQHFYSGLVSPTLRQHQQSIAPAAAHSAGPSSLAVSPALSTSSNLPSIAPAPMSLYSSQPSASLSPISPALAPFPTSSATSLSVNQTMASHILPDFPASSSASHAAAAAATGSVGATTTNSASNNASGGDSDSDSGDGDGSGENTPQQRTYHIFSRGSYDLMVWAILHGKGPDHRSISRACGDRPMTSKRWNRLQGNLRVVRTSPPGATDGLVYGMVLHPRDDPTLPLAQAQQLPPDAGMVEFRLVWRTCTRDLPIVPKEHWDAVFRSVHVRVGPDGRQFHLRLAECIRVLTTNYQTRRSRCGITTDHIRQMFTQCECQTSPAGRPRGARNNKSNPPGPSASGGAPGSPENNSSAGTGSNIGNTFGGGFASGTSSATGSGAPASGTPQQQTVNGAFDSTAYSVSPTSPVSHVSLSPNMDRTSGSPSPITMYTMPSGAHDSSAMDVCDQPGSGMHSIPSAAEVLGASAILTPPTYSREVPTFDQHGNAGVETPSAGDLIASWAVYGSGLKPAPVAMR